MSTEEIKKEDLDSMWKRQVEIDRCNEIITKLTPDEDFDLVEEFIHKLKRTIRTNEESIVKLKKYIDCEHINIKKGEYEGHDSHKSYYNDICLDCGKIIDSYSV